MPASFCSPLIATGSGMVLGYVEESCAGVLPPSPIVKVVRRRSTSLGLKKESYNSEEMRSDRMIVSSRHGTQMVDGDIVTEISPGGHEAFYEAVMGGNWVQSPGGISVIGPFSQNVATGVITFSALPVDPLTQFMRIGDVVRFSATTASFFDNQLFQIISLAATTMVVAPLKDSTFSIPASPLAAGTCRSQPRVSMSNIYRSFAFERAFEDIGSFITYLGCKFNSIAVDIPANGIATATFSVMGETANPLSSTSIDGTAALVLTDAVHGALTTSASAKTITAATGSFITAGLNVGDQIIIDGGGTNNFQNRVLRTITARTATVLTVAESVRSGTTNGAWTMTRLGKTTYDAAGVNPVLVGATGVVAFAGVPIGTITAMSLNLDNQMAGSNIVGSVKRAAILYGINANITGTMTILFDRGGAGEAAYNAFVNESDNLQVLASLATADGTKCVGFAMNRCKINSADIGDAASEGLPVTVEFVALKPTGTTTYTGVSSLVVIDTDAANPAAASAVT
jgi:hypothetical protein